MKRRINKFLNMIVCFEVKKNKLIPRFCREFVATFNLHKVFIFLSYFFDKMLKITELNLLNKTKQLKSVKKSE